MQKTHNTQITDEFQFSLIFSCLFSFLTFFFFLMAHLWVYLMFLLVFLPVFFLLFDAVSLWISYFVLNWRNSIFMNTNGNQEYVRVQSSFVSNESLIIRILILRPTIYADTFVFIYKHTILNHINCWKERLSFV